MKSFKEDLFELVFWSIVLLGAIIYYNLTSERRPASKMKTELKRNRFYDNCGAPNVLDHKTSESKGNLTVLRWS